MKKATYYSNCVSWPEEDVDAEGGLCDLVDACRTISRDTFLRHVDSKSRLEVERCLGYKPHSGLTMRQDWAVSYHRSTLHGKPVYLFKHSAIEYVFTFPDP